MLHSQQFRPGNKETLNGRLSHCTTSCSFLNNKRTRTQLVCIYADVIIFCVEDTRIFLYEAGPADSATIRRAGNSG